MTGSLTANCNQCRLEPVAPVEFDYDLLVIGSGPAGQRAAIQAAKINKRVAIAEKKTVVGGVCINLGTIPSKTLREAVIYLSGYRMKDVYGSSYTLKERITHQDLLFRVDYVVKHEIEVIRNQLRRNGIDLFSAEASFVDQHSIQLNFVDGSGQRKVTARHIIIAAGTHSTRDAHIPFDGKRVLTSDDIFTLDRLPKTLAVIGGGVIGCEYASIFATLGVRVTLIEKSPRLLSFIDKEIIDSFAYHLNEQRVQLRLGEAVKSIDCGDGSDAEKVRITLESGKQIVTEKALYCIGRTGATDELNLASVDLAPDDRGRLKVNENYQTPQANIYAVGDVIGFPSLASTSMEQGRVAACHAFGVSIRSVPALFPYGIYTIPEISTCGLNEEELTAQGVPYEVGKAQYKEIARGQILGDHHGLLKLIFHLETHKLLGVHIIGEGASELVHIGQTVMAFSGEVNYFVNTVFNYPTLAECYKTAAFDGLNRIS